MHEMRAVKVALRRKGPFFKTRVPVGVILTFLLFSLQNFDVLANVYTTSVLAEFFRGEVDIIGC